MANDLAHKINNPLQGLINAVDLASQDRAGDDAVVLVRQLSEDLQRLSMLVQQLLMLPGAPQ